MNYRALFLFVIVVFLVALSTKFIFYPLIDTAVQLGSANSLILFGPLMVIPLILHRPYYLGVGVRLTCYGFLGFSCGLSALFSYKSYLAGYLENGVFFLVLCIMLLIKPALIDRKISL